MSNGAQSERESEADGEKVGRETLGQMVDGGRRAVDTKGLAGCQTETRNQDLAR